MRFLCCPLRLALLVTLTLVARPGRAAPGEHDLVRYPTLTAKPVPINLAGYSGEVAQVLRFDLEVAGFRIVSDREAQYLLTGGGGGEVRGHLVDAISKATKFNQVFTGGTLRAQAHALSDAVVLAVTGVPGIATTKIAFKVTRGQASEVYYADYDGHGARALTRDQSVVAAPVWAPQRRLMLYTTYAFGNPDVVSHDLDSGARKFVARYAGSNISPAISPDGRRVAFLSSKTGNLDLYVANLDGSGLRQLTRTREDESSPAWSPDGRWICFAARFDGRRALAKISPEGGAVQRIPLTLAPNPTEPDWSPDGRWIAFTSQSGKYFNICLIPAEGGEARLLTEGEDPCWAANSRTLIYTRRTSSGRNLSLLDVPTKQHKDVPQSLGACSQPSWAR
ncbi:MAG: hypothetical protein FJ387_14000 [Verrucomicrobia bacterium]|nr:hypothetical protein [Verrucomicrobiota bacterium]